MPDRVTFSGNVHVGHSGYTQIGGNGQMTANTNLTIPTLGYKKADITINADQATSSAGKGTNIDISGVSSISITAETGKASVNYHNAYSYYFGGADGNYTVVLHN